MTGVSNTEYILRDKIQGIIYGINKGEFITGGALGDAVGLSTEFMTKEQARNLYGVGPIKFRNAKGYEFWRDRHRSRWFQNFTDDTGRSITFNPTKLLSTDGHLIPTHFAFRLKEWTEKGFPELSNKNPCVVGYTVGSVLSHPEFLSDPHKASYEVWDSRDRNLAANGAVIRTSVLGVPFFWDEGKVVENSINAAKVTHADPRSAGSAVIVSVIISRMLLQAIGDYVEIETKENIDENTILAKFDAGSPGSNSKEENDYESMFSKHPQPKLVEEMNSSASTVQPQKSILSRITQMVGRKKEPKMSDLDILLARSPKYEQPDNSRLTNPVKIPSETETMDSYGSNSENLLLCKKVVEDYDFLFQRSSLCETKSSAEEHSEPKWVEELHAHCFPSKLSDLNLDESGKIGYAFKCLGSAVYCWTRAQPLNQSAQEFFKNIITELTLEAGDSDTNCAVAGALLGCRLGKSGLPQDWLKGLRHADFLDEISNQLCSLIWLAYKEMQEKL